MYTLQKMYHISLLILGSVFRDCVLFHVDIFKHRKWPAQLTSTVPIVSAHFRSLLSNGRVCCLVASAPTEAAVVTTEPATAAPTTEEPGLCSVERGDAGASGPIDKTSYDLS